MLSSLANDCRRHSQIHPSSSLASKHQDVNGENAQLEAAEQDFSNEWVTSEWLHPCFRLSMLQNDSLNKSV